MTGPAAALAVLALIAGMLLAMAVLRRQAVARGWPAEMQRKSVHVGAGSLALALPWLFAEDWPVWLLLGLALAAMAALRARSFAGLGATLHGVKRRSWGDLLLVAAVGLVFLFSDGRAVLYVLPLAVLTLADAAAALAGTAYGRTRFATEDGEKSVEGSAIFFLVTLILSMTCLLLLSETPRENVIVLSLAIALFATVVEADSWQGFDNLFLPMGVLIFLSTTLDVPAWDAAARIAFLLGMVGAIFALVRAMGLSRHVARVHAMAFFLLLSVTGVQNAILPALMLLAQALAWPVAAQGRNMAALEIVGALALASFGFLAAGQATGVNAIGFYGLAMAAMAAGHAALIPAGRSPALRLAAAGLAALAAVAVWLGVLQINPPAVRPDAWTQMIGALLVLTVALIAALRPGAFAQRRALAVALRGAVPAAALYVYHAANGAPT